MQETKRLWYTTLKGTIRVGEVRFAIYPNDHSPRHTHAFIGSGFVVIELLPDGVVALSLRRKARRGVTDSEVRKALKAAASAYHDLVALAEEMEHADFDDR
jgi:hypothetical protein